MRLTARDSAFDAPADEDDDAVAYAPALYLEDKGADPAQLVESENYEGDNNSRFEAVKKCSMSAVRPFSNAVG